MLVIIFVNGTAKVMFFITYRKVSKVYVTIWEDILQYFSSFIENLKIIKISFNYSL